MSTIIMDLCSYTRLGLVGYLASRGVRKRHIADVETVETAGTGMPVAGTQRGVY
ncbi:Colanic acid capsular biosynthesis activation protein A [Cedecea neteri]|uniref:Colanic acid capsular biosynthesis activation protein A n=1 Tax=Cedecea neteri TaxID=158822 RepID=A0A2X3KWB4_9ENTR|nr:Colanic acid capsular biosynthesis activation protein A [Cedecea neteri]